MVGSPDAIRALVEPSLVSSGLDLWDVEVTRDTVRVLVDRPGGVDLDALAGLAGKVVSPLLDEHPELTPEGSFSLEVSSPGVERVLRRPEHYARYVGSPVSVKTTVAIDGARRHHGVLVSAGGDGVVVSPEGAAPGHTISIPHDLIDRVRTVLVWGPAPKPGSGKKPGPKKGQPPKGQARKSQPNKSQPSSTKAVKRPAATGPAEAGQPVASRERDSQ